MFIKVGDLVVNPNFIDYFTISNLETDLEVRVFLKTEEMVKVSGIQAIDLLMEICPSALEGRRLRWIKRAWMVHNLVGHPLMQIASFFGQNKLAMRIHDMTVPRPLGKK